MTDSLHTLLNDAIPELHEPPDRLYAIGRRVRRVRTRWAVAGSVLAVALLATAATLFPNIASRSTPMVRPPADPCRFLVRHRDGSPMYGGNGPLADPGGGWAAFCVNGRPSGTLTTKPDRLIGVLNALPALTNPKQPRGCSLAGLPNTDFVIGYLGGSTRTVEMDFNCGMARSGDGTVVRSDPQAAMNAFFGYYREQRAAATAGHTPGPVPCTARLTPDELAMTSARLQPRDEILRWGRSDLTPLPMRLAVVKACRYVADPDGVRLDRQAVVRTDLEGLRSVVNRSFEDSAFPRSQGQHPCLDRPDQARTITRLDVLWLTDASGKSLEVRIVRKPCAEVAGSGRSGFTPAAELRTALDQILGRTP
ncbi:MAG: hypothetical protein JWR24_2919 [Actinoallomurus sp.]|nr:hypothetical protein [Actinoallomurus sp.]